MAFPTLKAAAENAISLVSLAWPDPDQPNASACGDAIERAMRTVLSCREEGEHVRDEVIGRFLEKLAAVAGAVARTTASGLVRDSAVAQYDHNQWNFVAWADSGGFDAVGFTFRAAVRESDRRGIETVFVSKVAASTRDVGYYLRHRA